MAMGDVGDRTRTYSRAELVSEKVHRNPRGGIQGSGVQGAGAESILATRRYEDDVDLGHTILYTGQGGQHPDTTLPMRPQVADQEMAGLNRTLADNVTSGQPVRVIRDVPGGYRYSGLYDVVDVRDLRGKSGFRIFQYELHELAPGAAPPAKAAGAAPRRRVGPTDRIVRDTKMSREVKKLHDYTCQVCGTRLITKSGGYAEGAHVVALGDGGSDSSDNLLCMCPNHHALFDMGGLFVSAGLEATLADGTILGLLRAAAGHSVDPANFATHRARFGF